VRQDGGRDVVFVVRDGRAERRAVTTSGTLDQEVTIATGVAQGERVVVEGPTTLMEGTRVREKKP
jgi:acyl-[acyl carrier protein]--UDP-N-acetylglucosamine O-acyltransferase